MFAGDLDSAVEFLKLSVSSAKKLMDRETNRGTRLIEPISFVRGGERMKSCGQYRHRNNSRFHAASFVLLFVSVASVFKSGVGESGSFPNRLPSANAGSALSLFVSCTPAIRASSVSKCAIARKFGLFLSR